MTHEEKIAFFNSQVIAAQITAFGMVSENQNRVVQGHEVMYHEKDFQQVIIDYGIGHNDAVDILRG